MKRQETKRNFMPAVVAVIFIVIILLICVITREIEKRTPSDKKADVNTYFGFAVNDDESGILGGKKSDEIAIMINDKLLDVKGALIDKQVYLPVDVINDYLNKRFYWDSNENVLIYTTPTDIIRADVGSKDYTVGKNKQTVSYAIVKTEGSENCFVALDFVKEYTGLQFELFEEPNRIHIYTEKIDEKAVTAKKKKADVRVRHNIKSDILKTIDEKTSAYVLEEGKNWYKVYTDDGFTGYVRKKDCVGGEAKKVEIDYEEPVYASIQKDYTISMVWHQVTNSSSNDKLSSNIQKMKGVNTISPTWFSLSDNEGNLQSLASDSYVEFAHRCGMEVWGLVDNFKEEVSTKDILSYTSKRERLENQLISMALQYNLDGINIDFESIAPEAGKDFIQFIRELSTKCRANEIVLSIDNYVPGYTDYYDRKEQGIVADYVIIMGYDEHNGLSKESGSVASLPFVKEGIEQTLKEVPAEKVINAIPFFTRLWKEVPKTEEEIAAEDVTNADYIPYNLSSEAIGMSAMKKTIAASNATPVWDDTLKQNYLQYESDGATYKMWIEDAASIEEKLKLMKEYKLAGVAAWKLGLEDSDIWNVLVKYTN